MTEKFISPTMDWIYTKDPNWVSDTEALYKLGFSKRSLVDAHGYDVFGFNADGVDRLGCTEQDYENQELLAIGKASGAWMSLSQKLPIPLPRFLKLKTTFESLCRDKWDVEPGWVSGIEHLQQDGKARLYTHFGPDFTVGLHWYDRDDRQDNFFTIRTDVIARLQATGSKRELYFRVSSRSLGSNYQLVEDNVCAPNLPDAFIALLNYVNRHLRPVHNWHIRIVDTPDGAALAAYSTAELETAEGDRFGDPVAALRREDALQAVMDNAKTSAVEAMASAGIQSLIGHPAVIGGPKL
ncbi:hypothetical protein HFO56_03365 [Rhizobium laguerreae]|uniref:hypothetical protein n=1 Tax=Rhizobium laguerreae TaxID=1076926 RepID=UPI001C909A82|nr:hypothetical protein [Rhizobium laguerreae]MBY3151427.1 hypothetical protein [Rhizobium laguerreae]